MAAELRTAVCAVTNALAMLRAEPRSRALRPTLGQARAAVDALQRDVTSEVLRRLLTSIEDCHRDGIGSSPALAARCRSACRALRLDPRWTTLPTAPPIAGPESLVVG